jgi:asparagine N-glycosylation enzyme membrane subunit Stt3
MALSVAAVAALAAAGCGGGGSSKSSSNSSSAKDAGALSAEAQSAATGDIPDNQAFLVFRNSAAGYSIKYPEGWTTVGSGKDVKIQDKNNLVHIFTGTGPAPSPQTASAQLSKLKTGTPSLKVTSQPTVVTIKGRKTVKSAYSTESAPNSVTGKRVLLLVDRYQFLNKGKPVTVDLGTPKGVDNVDAYKMMIESFKAS